MQVKPVAWPPGRAMLTTRLSSGSHDTTMMGIVAVASFAARSPCSPLTTITFTLSWASSRASSGNRS